MLAQKGRAIRYARPVQNAVPAEFLNWLDGQNLTAKETVELLGQYKTARLYCAARHCGGSRKKENKGDCIRTGLCYNESNLPKERRTA